MNAHKLRAAAFFMLLGPFLLTACKTDPTLARLGEAADWVKTAAEGISSEKKVETPSSPAPRATPAPPPRPVAKPLFCRFTTKTDPSKSRSADVWEKVWRECPASPLAAHNYAIAALLEGKADIARKVLDESIARHPGFAPLQDLRTAMDAPIQQVSTIANQKLQAWLKRPSEVPAFTRKPSEKPEASPLPKLVKDEFETTRQFQNRVENARKARKREIDEIETRYQKEVSQFNKAVKAHNRALKKEAAARKKALPAQRERFLSQAMNQVLGNPVLKDLKYDADNQLFFAQLTANSGLFSKSVTIKTPLKEARAFKKAAASLKPQMLFRLKGEGLVVSGLRVPFKKSMYAGTFTEETFQPVVMTAAVEIAPPEIDTLPTMQAGRLETTALLRENEDYFKTALSLEEDPELAKLRQEEAELRRKQRQAAQRQARESEKARLLAKIQKQQAQLANFNSPEGNEFKGIAPKKKWTFNKSKPRGGDRLAVIIGNRNYGKGIPLVHYAHNDAKAMRQFFSEVLNLPKENILFELDATKGVLEGLFKSTLPSRVTPGETELFVYYSGHGMPIDRDAYLLPVDSRPATAAVTGYSRDLMLKQIAKLNVKSTTMVLDACFTGTDKDGDALLETKALARKPKKAKVDSGTLLISASGAGQVSWMDDNAGLSLMTLHFLEGLSGKADTNGDKKVNSSELSAYLKKKVNREALRLYERSQKPEVQGGNRVLVSY